MCSLNFVLLLKEVGTNAEGNQGPQGVHQDHASREEAPPQGGKDHYKEEQEELCHQVQAQNPQIPLHSDGQRHHQSREDHAVDPSQPQERAAQPEDFRLKKWCRSLLIEKVMSERGCVVNRISIILLPEGLLQEQLSSASPESNFECVCDNAILSELIY